MSLQNSLKHSLCVILLLLIPQHSFAKAVTNDFEKAEDLKLGLLQTLKLGREHEISVEEFRRLNPPIEDLRKEEEQLAKNKEQSEYLTIGLAQMFCFQAFVYEKKNPNSCFKIANDGEALMCIERKLENLSNPQRTECRDRADLAVVIQDTQLLEDNAKKSEAAIAKIVKNLKIEAKSSNAARAKAAAEHLSQMLNSQATISYRKERLQMAKMNALRKINEFDTKVKSRL